MGVDSKGLIKGKIHPSEIYYIIQTKFDVEADYDIRQDDLNVEQYIGRIHFNYTNSKNEIERRSIFFMTCDADCDKNYLPKDLQGSDYSYMSLGFWGDSEIILSEILKVYGGWLDFNDCDDLDYEYIPKDGDFKYSEYVELRNPIMGCLSENVRYNDKIMIATEIMKSKDKFIQLIM